MFEDVTDEDEEDEIEGVKERVDERETLQPSQRAEGTSETSDWRPKKPTVGPIQVMILYHD